MTSHCLSLALLCAMTMAFFAEGLSAGERDKTPPAYLVYFGTYTRGESEGIYVYRLDTKTGKLKRVGVVGDIVNPSFLAIHPNRKLAFAVTETNDFEGKRTGAVAAFSIDQKTGLLKQLNKQPSRGTGPCHLVVDNSGKNVLVANYGGGSVAALPIGDDGRLEEATGFIQHEGSSVNPRRQAGPHAHSINLDPAGRFAFAADLGLDKVLIYKFDADKGTLTPNDPAYAKVPPGGGPRHFAFRPDGRFAYTNNEMTSSVTAFRYNKETGALEPFQTISTLPEEVEGNSTAECQVHPSGRFLYVSNRGHNSIAMFTIDEESGRLTAIGHESTRGEIPRNFGVDPTGTFLIAANQRSNNVAVFRINTETGKLDFTGVEAEVPSPVCVKYLAWE